MRMRFPIGPPCSHEKDLESMITIVRSALRPCIDDSPPQTWTSSVLTNILRRRHKKLSCPLTSTPSYKTNLMLFLFPVSTYTAQCRFFYPLTILHSPMSFFAIPVHVSGPSFSLTQLRNDLPPVYVSCSFLSFVSQEVTFFFRCFGRQQLYARDEINTEPAFILTPNAHLVGVIDVLFQYIMSPSPHMAKIQHCSTAWTKMKSTFGEVRLLDNERRLCNFSACLLPHDSGFAHGRTRQFLRVSSGNFSETRLSESSNERQGAHSPVITTTTTAEVRQQQQPNTPHLGILEEQVTAVSADLVEISGAVGLDPDHVSVAADRL